MSKEITLKMLIAKKACSGQLEIFAKLFPDGVMITREVCIQHASTFDWDFAAQAFLGAPAQAAYESATAAAWADAYLSQE